MEVGKRLNSLIKPASDYMAPPESPRKSQLRSESAPSQPHSLDEQERGDRDGAGEHVRPLGTRREGAAGAGDEGEEPAPRPRHAPAPGPLRPPRTRPPTRTPPAAPRLSPVQLAPPPLLVPLLE